MDRRSLVLGFLIAILLFGLGIGLFYVWDSLLRPPQTQASPTELTATATSEPTPIPLSAIDLSAILVEPGDLPAGFALSQVRDDYPDLPEKFQPLLANGIAQNFERESKVSGWVVVLLVEDLDDLQAIFSHYQTQLEPEEYTQAKVVDNLGEQVVAESIWVPLLGLDPLESTYVVFTRCHALVYLHTERVSDYEGMLTYGRRLDKRLQDVLCGRY